MKYPSIKISLFALALFAIANLGPACAVEEPTPPEESDNFGYATDMITHIHTVGVDPCPQAVANQIDVFSYKEPIYPGAGKSTADSVVISNTTPGLNAAFENGMMSTALADQANGVHINFEFTCNIAMSFKHTYTLTFYKDGVEVATETFEVDVTVVE